MNITKNGKTNVMGMKILGFMLIFDWYLTHF